MEILLFGRGRLKYQIKINGVLHILEKGSTVLPATKVLNINELTSDIVINGDVYMHPEAEIMECGNKYISSSSRDSVRFVLSKL